MKVSILQSNYIPWKGYFDIIAKSDVFVIYDEVQYTKQDWRNRNLIKAKMGMQWLTIPVRYENVNQRIFETTVVDEKWKNKHIRLLQTNYEKSKYFDLYKNDIFDIYNNVSINLSEINKIFIKTICKILAIETKIIDSRELDLQGNKVERLIDACVKLNAKTYLCGPAAKSYLDEYFFYEKKIKLEWMDYSGYKEYNQLFPPFEHEVSILDLIFNEGPNARRFLKY